MATDPWAEFEEVTPVAPQGVPGVIPGRPKAPSLPTPPSEFAVTTDARDYERNARNDAFDNASKLRTEFSGLPQVRDYQTVIRQYDSALRTDATPTGDQALITAYAKMLDPTSVVREQEFNTVASGDSRLGQVYAKLAKELGLDNGGLLRPEVRLRVRENMRNLVQSYAGSYDQARAEYEAFASRAGVDPQMVVGSHYGEPFKERIESYWSKAGIKIPETRGGYPVGTQIQWDVDSPETPFDRAKYLLENWGVTDQKEAALMGVLNANTGNAKLTAQDVREMYRLSGVPQLDDAGVEEVLGNLHKGNKFGGIDTSRAEGAYNEVLDQEISRRFNNDPESVTGAIGINAAQGVTIGSLDEFSGVMGGITAALTGENPVTGYQVERDLVRREQQRAQEARPVTSLISEIGASLPTAGLGFNSVNSVRQAATAGAKMGALAGFNYGEGPVGSPVGALTGAVTGAGIGAGVQALSPAIQRNAAALLSRPQATPEQTAIMEAGGRIGVPTRAADVRPDLRQNRANVLSEGGDASQMVRQADLDDRAAMEAARSKVAPGNAAQDTFALGERGQAVVSRELKNTRTRAKRQYEIATRASNGQTFTPAEAIATADSEIARLRSEGASDKVISYIEGLKTKLERPEGWTPMQLHALRADLRNNISAEGLPVDAAELPALRAIDAATVDMEKALAGNAKALKAMQEGDRIWRERAKFREEVSDNLFGKRRNFTPDQTGRALESMVRNDAKRTAELFQRMEPEERADLAATFVERMGNDANGNFSFARFLSQTEGKGAIVSPRSMRLLFGDDGMRAINDMRTVAQSKVDAADRTNWSGTGGVVKAAQRGLRMTLFALLGGSSGGASGAVLAPAADNFVQRMGAKRMARMLTNPDVTRLFRNAPNSTEPAAINRWFAKFKGLAARSPAMQADIEALKQALLGFANDNTAIRSAAAEPGGADADREGAN